MLLEEEGEEEITLITTTSKPSLPPCLPPFPPASEQILSELAQQKENMDVEDSQGGFAEGQRSEIC